MEQLDFPVTKKDAEKQGLQYSSGANKNARFPVRLRQLRAKKEISQAALAEQLGVSKSTVGLYETGDTLPDAKTVRDLAVYFEVSADYLLGLSEFPRKELEELSASELGLSVDAVSGIAADRFLSDVDPKCSGILEGMSLLLENVSFHLLCLSVYSLSTQVPVVMEYEKQCEFDAYYHPRLTEDGNITISGYEGCSYELTRLKDSFGELVGEVTGYRELTKLVSEKKLQWENNHR